MASCTALRVKVQVRVLTAELLRSQCGCYDGRFAPLGHGEGNAEMRAHINAIGDGVTRSEYAGVVAVSESSKMHR